MTETTAGAPPKIVRKTGMAARTASTLAARRAARDDQALIAGPPPTDGSARTTSAIQAVDPRQLADNPRNQASRIEDVSDLADIEEFGVLQPLLVTPAATFLEAFPDYATAIGSADYVILAGHRRKAAAIKYGLAEVPVYIRTDLSADGRDAAVRILENTKRRNLDPISEALDYQRLRDENGMKVRAIGELLRISHSLVSKRLGLLTLPAPLQQSIASGHLRTSYAESIASTLTDPESQLRAALLLDSGVPLGEALVDAADEDASQRRLAALAALDEAAEPAEDAGPAELDAPQPEPLATHRDEVPAQRTAAEPPAAAPTHTTGEGKPARTAASAAAPSSASHDAAARRFTICEQLAANRPSPDEAAEAIARHCLSGAPGHRDAVRLAHRWLRTAGVGPTDLAEPSAYIAAVAPNDLVHVAYVVALAADEVRIRDPRRAWDRRDLAHLHRLEQAGYTPTDWERDRLTAVTR